jgi:hypothetical protein
MSIVERGRPCDKKGDVGCFLFFHCTSDYEREIVSMLKPKYHCKVELQGNVPCTLHLLPPFSLFLASFSLPLLPAHLMAPCHSFTLSSFFGILPISGPFSSTCHASFNLLSPFVESFFFRPGLKRKMNNSKFSMRRSAAESGYGGGVVAIT